MRNTRGLHRDDQRIVVEVHVGPRRHGGFGSAAPCLSEHFNEVSAGLVFLLAVEPAIAGRFGHASILR